MRNPEATPSLTATFAELGKSFLGVGKKDAPKPGFTTSIRAASEGAVSSRRKHEGFGAHSERTTMASFAQTIGNMQSVGIGVADEKPRPTVNQLRQKKLKTHISTKAEVFDQKAELTFTNIIEQPLCLRSCIDSPHCQIFCHPAEHATRHRRKQKMADLENGTGGAENGAVGRKFGLPDFVNAGFALVPLEEAVFEDLYVPSKLFLQYAIHRKTSVERLCLVMPKLSLPKESGPEQIRLLVRNLLRCDHVNVLRCLEACEDPEYLYFLYENWPSVTFFSVLEIQTWSQDQLVNIAREICAATAFASSVGLGHLGLTFFHVLFPTKCLDGDVTVAKVFGFGLMGALFTDSVDRQCWSPEMVEKWKQCAPKQNFIQRVENMQKAACDSWGLGVIVYTLIARRAPWSSINQTLEEMILSHKWGFSSAFDEYDNEAKGLVESLLNSAVDKRLLPLHALRHEWIRSRWRPPLGCSKNLEKLEDFCGQPRAKRLFGRFLVRFLIPEHMRLIALSFYTLDARGDGVLDDNDLVWAAELSNAQHPKQLAANSIAIMGQGFPVLSLSRYAESMAENVIDGKALRHAFESLDDDGSEQISAPELFDALGKLDPALTMDEVVAHIDSAELGVGEDCATQDHQLDFEEFTHLFPERMKKMVALDDRLKNTTEHSDRVSDKFEVVRENAHQWVAALDQELESIRELSAKIVDRRVTNNQFVFDLRKHFHKVRDHLRRVPGPIDAAMLEATCKATAKKQISQENQAAKGKKAKKEKNGHERSETYGFDSFLQDQALIDLWPVIVLNEVKLLNAVLSMGRPAAAGAPAAEKGAPPAADAAAAGQIDQYKAHDAAESMIKKVEEVMHWTKAQLEEYESFVEVLTSPETPMHGLSYSGRGLQQNGEEDEPGEDRETELNIGGDSSAARGSRSTMLTFVKDVTSRGFFTATCSSRT